MDIGFRHLRRDDLHHLAAWQAQEHVARWWGPSTREVIEAEYTPVLDGTEPSEVFIIELDKEAAGQIQRYRIRDYPEWLEQLPDAADLLGIDYYIGDLALCYRGLGAQVIAAFVDETLLAYPDADGVMVLVLIDNRPSWRALEKAGFSRLRQQFIESEDPYDRGPHYVYARLRNTEAAR